MEEHGCALLLIPLARLGLLFHDPFIIRALACYWMCTPKAATGTTASSQLATANTAAPQVGRGYPGNSFKMSRISCRFYEQRFPEVDDVVMVRVKSIAEMGAYGELTE